MGARGFAGELVGAVGSIPGVRLLGGVLPERQAARTFLNRWVRRGILAGFGVGFTVPYFSILNDVHVEGDEILPRLPAAATWCSSRTTRPTSSRRSRSSTSSTCGTSSRSKSPCCASPPRRRR